MDPALKRRIIDVSDEELTTLGLLGPNVAPGVEAMIRKVKANPTLLGSTTCFVADCLRRKYPLRPQGFPARRAFPTSPTVSEAPKADTVYSLLSNNSDTLTVVAPHLISEYEMRFWYHGISGDPPKLMYRSDLETNPFPTPTPGARFFKVPTKTAHGVFGTRLNTVWHTVAPLILQAIKAHGLQYSALKGVRFSTLEDGQEQETFGPVVVWIAVRPNTTKAGAVRDATPDILGILANEDITDVVVEWYEGSVQRLAGPPLMNVEDNDSPNFGLNHPFNTGLGIPIARQSDDVQGTLTFLFREVKASDGKPSDRILAVTDKHVATLDTTTHYDFDAANPQYILVCSDRRLARAISEIEDAVSAGFRDVVKLSDELAQLELIHGAESPRLERRQRALKEKNETNDTLQALFDEVKANWQDANGRRLGAVDWAPEISVRVDDRTYTRDIATFVVDKAKLENFTANIVDLGNQFTATQLEDRFWPNGVADGRTIPASLQLPIHSALHRRLVLKPDTKDKNNEPLYIVGKYGSATKLTLGRYSGMEAYTCTDLGLESREVVVYNYSKTSGNFSDRGDSGSLIFTGDGHGLAVLHSGMPRGMHNHITYATPLWWVIKQVLVKYPFAEFYGITYNLDD